MNELPTSDGSVPSGTAITDEDAANIGRDLMDRLPKDYMYNNSPAEIVPDLQNQIYDLGEALKEAVQNCPCTIAERNSGHRVDCRAPGWNELLENFGLNQRPDFKP